MVLRLLEPSQLPETQHSRAVVNLQSKKLAQVFDCKDGSEVRLPRGIIEISGEPGSGKTQLCIELAVSNVNKDVPDIERPETLVIDTEHCWSVQRVRDMCLAQNIDDNIVLTSELSLEL